MVTYCGVGDLPLPTVAGGKRGTLVWLVSSPFLRRRRLDAREFAALTWMISLPRRMFRAERYLRHARGEYKGRAL